MQDSNTLPEKFLERLKRIYSEDEYAQVLKSFSHRPAASFRTKTIKITTEALEQRLIQEGFVFTQVPWYQDAFVLQNKSIRELTETDAYKEGLLYIQNLSSMIPALV